MADHLSTDNAIVGRLLEEVSVMGVTHHKAHSIGRCLSQCRCMGHAQHVLRWLQPGDSVSPIGKETTEDSCARPYIQNLTVRLEP